MGLDVDENGAVVAALAGGVLVNADHTRGGRFRLGQGVDQAQDGAPADAYPERGGQAGAGAARQREADRGRRRAQPLGPLTVPTGQAGYLLDEGAAGAFRVPAGKPADPQLKNNASSGAGRISRKPQVGTMDPVRPDPARRARAPFAVHSASTRTIAMLTSTDSTATSAIDGNNSSFNRGTASSTDPNCQPSCLDHGSCFRATSRTARRSSAVTQRGRVTEPEPEPLHVDRASHLASASGPPPRGRGAVLV